LPAGTRLPTERTSPAMSAHQARTPSSLPGAMVATIKIALLVIGWQTDCGSRGG